MSFVSLNQKELASLLSICNQVSPKKSDIEIFTYLKVTISEKNFFVEAINSQAYFCDSLSPKNLDVDSEKIEFLIKTDVLTNSVALIKDDNVGIEINLATNQLLLQGSSNKYNLRTNTDKLSDFAIPRIDSQETQAKLRCLAGDLLDAIKIANISVGLPKLVYEPKFLNICFTVDDSNKSLYVVSTDRYRITKTRLPAQFSKLQDDLSDKSTNFLILPKPLQYLISAAAGFEGDIEIDYRSDFVVFSFDAGSQLILRYGEGKYPDYNQIIPQSFACSFMLNKDEALEALKQVYLFARSSGVNKSVNIQVDPTSTQLKLESKTEDGYSSQSTISLQDYQGSQESWTQSFNADYLLAYISNIKEENILWEANPGKPSVLSPLNKKDTQLYLVSGLR